MKITVEYIEIEGKQVRVNTYPSGQKSYGWEDENGDMVWSDFKPLTSEERDERDEKLSRLRRKANTALLGLACATGALMVEPIRREK